MGPGGAPLGLGPMGPMWALLGPYVQSLANPPETNHPQGCQKMCLKKKNEIESGRSLYAINVKVPLATGFVNAISHLKQLCGKPLQDSGNHAVFAIRISPILISKIAT